MYFFPEPLERVQYLTALVLAPALLLSFYLFFRIPAARIPVDRAMALERRLEDLAGVGLIGLLVAAMGRSLSQSQWFGWGATGFGLGPRVKAGSVVASFMLALLVAAIMLLPSRFPALERVRRPAEGLVAVLAFSLMGLAALFSLIGLGSVTESINYISSFNAVFHGMSQVYLGREILHDFNYQYGLFPHLIEPLFRVFGLSVLSFSIVMALLNLAGFLLLWPVLRLLVARVLLAGLTLVAILYAGYFDGRQSFDLYYQYHPIRFFFPALSLFLASRYYLRGGHLLYYASFVVGSVAVLWNCDTGVVVLLAWLMTLVFKELVVRRPKQAALHLVTGAGVFAATVGAYSLTMVLRYGHAPDLLSAFYYQKLFYVDGFGMLPMPALHPWNAVAMIYAAGILYAVMHLAERRLTSRSVCVFHLSVLGAGIFSYFQGRSVNSSLACVSYPALILAAFFADRLLDNPPGRPGVGRSALVGTFLFMLAFCGVGMVRIAPVFIGAIFDHGRKIASPEETPVMRNARFIKEQTRPGEEVLVISYLSGIYHLESGTLSPGGVRTLVDLRQTTVGTSIKFNLNKIRTVPKVFLGSEWDLKSVRELMFSEFRLAGAAPDGSMLLFTPK